jgi:hypothetical protein
VTTKPFSKAFWGVSLLLAFIPMNLAWGQSPANYTNFPMIGVVRGQTVQLNISAFPPDPCFATLGFQDASGNPVGTTMNVTLQGGQSASLPLNGNTLTTVAGQRVEVQPTVTLTAGVVSQCTASTEVYDNILKISSVVVPGATGYPPSPVFGMIGVTVLQTARLNVVAFPPEPCIAQLSFVNSQGAQVGNTLNVQLSPGQATSLDLPGSTLVTGLGQRAEVQPVVSSTNGGCAASAEVYINGLGTTSTFYPPDPCISSSSCAVSLLTAQVRALRRLWSGLDGLAGLITGM